MDLFTHARQDVLREIVRRVAFGFQQSQRFQDRYVLFKDAGHSLQVDGIDQSSVGFGAYPDFHAVQFIAEWPSQQGKG